MCPAVHLLAVCQAVTVALSQQDTCVTCLLVAWKCSSEPEALTAVGLHTAGSRTAATAAADGGEAAAAAAAGASSVSCRCVVLAWCPAFKDECDVTIFGLTLA